VIALAEQIVCEAGVAVACGVGFTITVAVIDGPVQVTPALVKLGVMVKVTVCGTLLLLVRMPVIGVPEPLAGMPVTITLLSLIQLNTVPTTFPVSAIGVIAVVLQIVCDDGVATAFGIGFTTTVAVKVGPGHPFADGVMVNVTVIGAKVVFVSDPLIGVPAPLAGIPVTVATLSLTHVYVVPATGPLNTIGVIALPEQIVCVAGVAVPVAVG